MHAMRRLTICCVLAVMLAPLVPGAGEAVAAKKKGKGAKTTAPKADARAVSELMGPFTWGMSPEQVVGILGKQIEEKQADALKATSDVYAQDKIRKKIADQKARIQSTLVKFEGQKLSLDVSIVGREYAHNNDESLLIYDEFDPESKKDQQRYFFFWDGKLWKMFIAFNAERFEGKGFADFQAIMEARYGAGQVSLPTGKIKDEVTFVFWKGGSHYLRALDFTQFYGNFCLAISEDKVEQTIHAKRAERNPPAATDRAITESVTEKKDPQGAKPVVDETNADVVDRIMGGRK
jgi:hypothetical protein